MWPRPKTTQYSEKKNIWTNSETIFSTKIFRDGFRNVFGINFIRPIPRLFSVPNFFETGSDIIKNEKISETGITSSGTSHSGTLKNKSIIKLLRKASKTNWLRILPGSPEIYSFYKNNLSQHRRCSSGAVHRSSGSVIPSHPIWHLAMFTFWLIGFTSFRPFSVENMAGLSCVAKDNWDTDYNSYNWEPEFMTIFVTWQSRETVDSIRNSCNVWA